MNPTVSKWACILVVLLSNNLQIESHPAQNRVDSNNVAGSPSKNPFTYGFSDVKDSPAVCIACKYLVGLLHNIAAEDKGLATLEKIAKFICDEFKLFSERICTLGMHQWGPTLLAVITADVIEPHQICGLFLGKRCADVSFPFPSWNITIPPRRGEIEERPFPSKEDVPISKVLHLTDIHLDLEYKEGARARCGEPMCCRANNGIPKPGEITAPKWGYAGFCDTNVLLQENLFQHLREVINSDIDYIIWTGDIPPHDVWNQTREDNLGKIDYAVRQFLKWFPGVKVYPALGNHESSPVDSFPPPFVTDKNNNKWLLNSLAEEWGHWLPESCKDTIRKGGYYTVLVNKGLRIVSLNMNYFNGDNWWLVINSVDPADQLKWLVEVLSEAEANKEKVHILGHIPPDEGLRWWSYNYYKIIDRFQDTVAAQFFGHTHYDEFRIFYDTKTWKQATNIAYIGPSVTTFHDLNPGFRIYDVEASGEKSSRAVLDHHTYIMDLDKVNKTGEAKWELEYSALKHFNMKSLAPSEWDALLKRMVNDEELFQDFYRFYFKKHVPSKCDLVCKKSYLCTMKTALSGGFHNFCDFDDTFNLKHVESFEKATYNKC